jgi:CheY-like chemotaxis protein
VREAADGFGALAEIKSELPDILISDLNMPAMCGFELLAIVRRRFPSIGAAAAMSGAYSRDIVPTGVAADAFFAKGAVSTGSFLGMVNVLIARDGAHQARSATPIWIHRFAIDSHPEAAHLAWCPECLRTFSQHAGDGRLAKHCSLPALFE